MGWVSRGQRRYFYRSVRIDGRPRRIYLGHGAVGELHARIEVENRQRREVQRRAREAQEHRLLVAEAALDELGTQTYLVAGAMLLVAGHHEHNGEWRRVR